MEVFRRLPFDSLGTSGSAALKDAAPTPDH
jgi:hypothetical protein